MKVTLPDVEQVAKLARLEVSPAEKEAFAKQLSQILTHVETLKQYDTGGIEPTATVVGGVNVFREDLAQPSLPVEIMLVYAPELEAVTFAIPWWLRTPSVSAFRES